MSLGYHNHLAVSLAPPRLYFTGLKTTPGATSSTRNPSSIRKRSGLVEKRETRLPYPSGRQPGPLSPALAGGGVTTLDCSTTVKLVTMIRVRRAGRAMATLEK